MQGTQKSASSGGARGGKLKARVIDEALEVIKREKEALSGLLTKIDGSFERAFDILLNIKGHVLVSGLGKSGIIARKISTTLTSTGTPATFLHPTEGLHGDIGILSPRDAAIIISNSGGGEDLLPLLTLFRKFNTPVILITSDDKCQLSKYSDVTIAYGNVKEACPFNLVPTSSAVVSMAIGDALAVTLMKAKGFKKEDYALLHPGGSIGARMLTTVSDLMHTGDEHPEIGSDCTLRQAIMEMTCKKLGVTAVTSPNGALKGVITDGDLRRILDSGEDGVIDKKVADFLKGKKAPKTVLPEMLAVKALAIMREFSITSLVVTGKSGKPEGTIHIHDILKAGIA
ncbi:MAG: SIS domain-containing protein [Fibrobacterota bacterium]